MGKKKAPPRTPNPRPRKPRSDGGVRALRKLVEQTRRAHGKMVHQAALAQRQADVLAARLREAEAKLTAALERIGPAAAGRPKPPASPGRGRGVAKSPVNTKSRVRTKSPVRTKSRVKTSPGGASRKPATRASGARKAPSPKRPAGGAGGKPTTRASGPPSRKPTPRASGPTRGPAPKRPTRGTNSSGRPRRGPGRSPRP